MADKMEIDDFEVNDLADIEDIVKDVDNVELPKEEKKQPEAKLVTKKTLDLYYRYAFPFKLFFKWLGNNNSGIAIQKYSITM